MSYTEDIELRRGYKEYDSKIKNLENIFNKIDEILDISIYSEELQKIKKEADNDYRLSKKMLSFSMQMDYEGFIFGDYIKRLDALTKKVEDECVPFYELHLLYSKINIQLSQININNINEIIENTKLLIDALNSSNTHNKNEKNILIQKAYETIYSVIIYEDIFERNDILSYIISLNIPTNIENISTLLSMDLKNIDEIDLIDENLRTIKSEGLGYDYLNSDFIRKISRKKVGKDNPEYIKRKNEAISKLSTEVIEFSNNKNNLTTLLDEKNSEITKLYINKAILTAKILSMVLIPCVTFGIGNSIGKNASNKITEYKTITRTIDSQTGKIIGDIESIYDENETTYVATVMAYSPWKANPTGVGYIRNVTAYEYIAPDDIEDGYHATKDDLDGNVLEKYKFVESKDILENNDSTTDSIILITETFQDKNDTRKSKKFIVPFSIMGAGIGIVTDVILVLSGIYSLEKIARKLNYLNDEINEYKLDKQMIKNKLINMKHDAILLQNTYNSLVKKYGSFGDEFIIPDIDTKWITEEKSNRRKRKI